ncbi:MAG: DUF3237 family protein [Gammaproteobacteria bacterium]|nr:DUF3237 family protein [Gammaproteobacteria bacterium]
MTMPRVFDRPMPPSSARFAVNARSGAAAAAAVVAIVTLACAVPAAVRAQDGAGSVWPVAGVEPPQTELVLEAYVTIGDAVEVGVSDHGTRRFIPITGGRFVGRGLSGRVMPGGADWQLERADGVLELYALYSLETDDGDVIVVENEGIASAIAPADGEPAQRYLRTSPRFHAPQGEHDWLNKGIFVGSVTPDEEGGAVVIRVFHVLPDGRRGAVAERPATGSDCTGIASGVARLDCYDTAFGRSSAARSDAGDATADDAAVARARQFSETTEAEPEQAYTVTVVEVRRRRTDAIFVTEEGETWLQTDGRRFFAPDVPFEAEIRPGALGSNFLVPLSGGRAIRVREP